MKYISFSLISLIVLSACAHVEYVGAGDEPNSVSVKGNRYALIDDARDAAKDHNCKKPFFHFMGTTAPPNIATGDKDRTPEPEYVYTFNCDTKSAKN